jgi:hypothetical protein
MGTSAGTTAAPGAKAPGRQQPITPGQMGQGNLGQQSAGAMTNAYQGNARGLAGFGQPPSTIAAGMGAYQNPYQQQVIDRTAADMARQTRMGLNDIGGEAAMSGAFGGSRHGLMEAQAIAEGQRSIGDMSANLRQQGFNTAAGLAQQDIGNYGGMLDRSAQLGQQGLGMAQGMLGQNAQNGQTIGGINNALVGQGAGMFDQWSGHPLSSVMGMLGALSGNPLNSTGTQTQTGTPGTKSMLSNAVGIASRMPMGM